MGTAPFGSLLAGSLAKLAGTPATIFVGGISWVAGALLFYRKLPELRKLVRPVYVQAGIIPEVAAGIETATEPLARVSDCHRNVCRASELTGDRASRVVPLTVDRGLGVVPATPPENQGWQ